MWGYDPFAKQMIDPTQYVDMMSYCSPTWISDYHYARIFTRVRSDNQYYDDWMRGDGVRRTRTRYSLAPVGKTGGVNVTTSATREPWVSLGQPREATWAGGSSTAYFFPYDHLPGGVLYVPDEVPSGARVAHLREGEAALTIAR